jgi:hypothetical protein
MRVPTQQNRTKARVAVTRSVPAPVKGWNSRDSIANMDPLDAVVLDDWFPTTSDVKLRKGSASHVTGITGEVETLIAFKPETGSQSLWGWANSAIYNVSSAGAVGAAAVSGLTSIRWQVVNFKTTAGNFLLCVNGADSMRTYNGTTWTTITGASSPAITGVDTDDLIHVNVFKERPWYIEKASMNVWYPAAGAFSGALTKLPLQSVFKRGGYLMAMGTWTLDSGSGMDDLAVFVSSEGEAAVYQGNNPASAATWALIGVYNIGKPIGRRCMQKLGGDLLIITTDGVVPASRAFVKGRSEGTAVAITDRIQGGMSEAVSLYGGNFGWEAVLYPEGPALIVNVPSEPQQQFVMNTVTKAWCRFTAWEANCFEEFNGALYYGMSGAVRKAWTGTADVTAQIEGELVQAFNYFGNRNQIKQFTMLQPIIGWDSNPAQILIGVDVDFDITDPTNSITLPQSTGGVWGTGLWGAAVWGGEPTLKKAWYSASGLGYAAALHLTVSSTAANVSLASVSYVFQPGGVL